MIRLYRRDALEFATESLPGFDRETMRLDGKPVKLAEVMRLTNARRKAEGKPQVDYNPDWRVP